MNFKDFIKMDEVGTSTSSIASFKRISIPLTRRIFPPEIGWIDPEDDKKGKKKPYRVPQIDENMGAFMQGINQGLGVNPGNQSPVGPNVGANTGPNTGDQMPDMKNASKEMATSIDKWAQQLSNDPSNRNFVTLLKTMSSTYNRLGDQWQQVDNSTNDKVASGIQSVGGTLSNIIGRSGSLTQKPTSN